MVSQTCLGHVHGMFAARGVRLFEHLGITGWPWAQKPNGLWDGMGSKWCHLQAHAAQAPTALAVVSAGCSLARSKDVDVSAGGGGWAKPAAAGSSVGSAAIGHKLAAVHYTSSELTKP